MTGCIGDIACFSFYPTKNLGALGDAGITATDDPALATALREIREYGWRDRYISARVGINTRLDPIQAAILGARLPYLKGDNARRQAIAARYDAGLAELPLDLPPRRPECGHVFHQYVIRVCDAGLGDAGRDRLRDRLSRAHIGTGIHYPAPVHRQPAYQGRLAEFPAGLPKTTRVAGRILSLPMYPQLSAEAAERVVAEIRDYFD
jgi:dTDP-4-amino-4,6-dideoxygalactose transaminase